MARTKKPEKVQSRNFKVLLYPDNPDHVRILDTLQSTFTEHIGILHDANEERKEHYHVGFKLEKPLQLGTICRKLGMVDDMGLPDLQFIRVCDGRFDRFLVYLTHLDDQNKEQYAASELFGSSALLSDYGRAATRWMRQEFDMSDCVLACIDWMRGRGDQIITMTGFARWICNTPYFRASSSPLVRACIMEHNNRIYNAYRSEYLGALSDSQEKYQALLQYPEADPQPPSLPPDAIIGSEELIW